MLVRVMRMLWKMAEEEERILLTVVLCLHDGYVLCVCLCVCVVQRV